MMKRPFETQPLTVMRWCPSRHSPLRRQASCANDGASAMPTDDSSPSDLKKQFYRRFNFSRGGVRLSVGVRSTVTDCERTERSHSEFQELCVIIMIFFYTQHSYHFVKLTQLCSR